MIIMHSHMALVRGFTEKGSFCVSMLQGVNMQAIISLFLSCKDSAKGGDYVIILGSGLFKIFTTGGYNFASQNT